MIKQPLLSVVITGHGFCPELTLMLESLENQKRYVPCPHSRDVNVTVPYGKCVDWTPEDWPGVEIILTWDGPCKYLPVLDPHVKLIENDPQGSPGHHTRGPGIEAATGKFVVLTNADNYFCAGWLDQILPALQNPHCGMVYWDVVNSLWGWAPMQSYRMSRGHIDLSCVAVGAGIAKKVKFPYTNYDGDWDYIDACNVEVFQSGLERVHIPKTLCVHN